MLGGSGEVQNLRLLCAPHNQFEAERMLGRERIERAKAKRERASDSKPSPAAASDDAQLSVAVAMLIWSAAARKLGREAGLEGGISDGAAMAGLLFGLAGAIYPTVFLYRHLYRGEKAMSAAYQPVIESVSALSAKGMNGAPGVKIREGAGILILSKESDGVPRLDAERMLALPAACRANTTDLPLYVIIFELRSERIGRRVGVGAGSIDEYWYVVNVLELTTETTTRSITSPRSKSIEFPEKEYQKLVENVIAFSSCHPH